MFIIFDCYIVTFVSFYFYRDGAVGSLIQEPEVPARYPVRPHTFVSPSADSRRVVVTYWRKYVYMYEVLVNRLGCLSLPRKSGVRSC